MATKEKIIFEINGADVKKLKRFERQHKNCSMGMEGGKFSYTFIPTGLGLAITVECSCGQHLLLGNFLDGPSEEYDEKKLRPLTDADVQNQMFEDAAQMILTLENHRLFGMAMGREQNFEITYAYAVGLARYADPRISKAILYKVSLDKQRREILNYTGTEAENLTKFFEYFKRVVLEEMDKYHSKNERLREMCDEKYVIVKSAIDKIDVYGLLEHGAPNDEFETEAREVAKHISMESSVEEIAKTISDVINIGFSLETDFSRFLKEAEIIYKSLHY